MSIIQGTAKASGDDSFYPFEIGQSLRFDGSTGYLSKTLSSISTFTLSMWIKGSGGSTGYVFSSGTDVGLHWISHDTDGRMYMNANNAAAGNGERYRDLSAWYNIVLQSNSGTAKFWVNNRAATTDGTTVATVNSFTVTGSTYFGIYTSGSTRFHGYMAEINFIDGQALNSYYFGEFKNGSVWIPKQFDGTASDTTYNVSGASNAYGTNGFRLSFASSDFNTSGSAITDPHGSSTNVPDGYVADASGSGNHWDVN